MILNETNLELNSNYTDINSAEIHPILSKIKKNSHIRWLVIYRIIQAHYFIIIEYTLLIMYYNKIGVTKVLHEVHKRLIK